MAEIHGSCDPPLATLRDVFARSFERSEKSEAGAAGGFADAARTQP
jgi:hypothetical protein